MANQMYEMGRGVRSCTEPMGVPAVNWKLEPARFSETVEQIYCPARYKNVEEFHWSNTRRENVKPCIVIRDTETSMGMVVKKMCVSDRRVLKSTSKSFLFFVL
jgi:hypothetical protein